MCVCVWVCVFCDTISVRPWQGVYVHRHLFHLVVRTQHPTLQIDWGSSDTDTISDRESSSDDPEYLSVGVSPGPTSPLSRDRVGGESLHKARMAHAIMCAGKGLMETRMRCVCVCVCKGLMDMRMRCVCERERESVCV